eukprot:jgi/Bigna1/129472/aug1.9_g4180
MVKVRLFLSEIELQCQRSSRFPNLNTYTNPQPSKIKQNGLLTMFESNEARSPQQGSLSFRDGQSTSRRHFEPIPATPPVPTPRHSRIGAAGPVDQQSARVRSPIINESPAVNVGVTTTPSRMMMKSLNIKKERGHARPLDDSKIATTSFHESFNRGFGDKDREKSILEENMNRMNEKLEYIQILKTQLRKEEWLRREQNLQRSQELDEVHRLSQHVVEQTQSKIHEAEVRLNDLNGKNGELAGRVQALEQEKASLASQVESMQGANGRLQRAVSREGIRASDLETEESRTLEYEQLLADKDRKLREMESVGEEVKKQSTKTKEQVFHLQETLMNERNEKEKQMNVLKDKFSTDLSKALQKKDKQLEDAMMALKKEQKARTVGFVTYEPRPDGVSLYLDNYLTVRRGYKFVAYVTFLLRHLQEAEARDKHISMMMAEAMHRAQKETSEAYDARIQKMKESQERKLQDAVREASILERDKANARVDKASNLLRIQENSIGRLTARIETLTDQFNQDLSAERSLVLKLQSELSRQKMVYNNEVEDSRRRTKGKMDHFAEEIEAKCRAEFSRLKKAEIVALKKSHTSKMKELKAEKRALKESLKDVRSALSATNKRLNLLEEGNGDSGRTAEELMSLRVRAGVMTKAAENAKFDAEEAIKEAKMATLRAERAELDLRKERKVYAMHLDRLSEKIQRQLSLRRVRRSKKGSSRSNESKEASSKSKGKGIYTSSGADPPLTRDDLDNSDDY